jgi:signal transduction histidine kinase
MREPVSGAVPAARIQETPETDRNKGGSASDIDELRQPAGSRAYRTWPIFSFALVALLALILVPPLTALRRSEAIYSEIRASEDQFQHTQRVFEALAQNVFTVSITIREFLLDTSPDAGHLYRSKLTDVRAQLEANLDRLRQSVPSDGGSTLTELQRQVEGYLGLVSEVFDWTAKQRIERGAFFLREEQRPRRETILAMAEQLSELNASMYATQQQRITDSELTFRSQLRQSLLLTFLAGVVISSAGILRMRSLERRARLERLQAQAATIEMRNLSVQLRRAQEEERRVISRELHDEVGQTMTALRMELGTLHRLRDADRNTFDASLTEIKALAERSVHTIRDIASMLRPPVLYDLGLDAAVQKQVREFSLRTGISATADVQGSFGDLTDRQRTYVYRVVQEALTNCAKHSDAREVSVIMTERKDAIALTIADNGVGFDRAVMGHGGLGLVGIEERVRELGGTVVMRSAIGQGVTIYITIPRQTHDESDPSPDR